MAQTPDPARYDSKDVPLVIKEHTGDGPGVESEDELPASDFEGFPEENVLADYEREGDVK